MKNKTTEEMIEELRHAAQFELTETGEQWQSLVEAQTAAEYGSEEFEAAWEKEVKKQYEYFKDNFRFVIRKQTREVEHTELEFIG